eukprot:765361-Hanusia_phi.AAC.2
MEEEQLERRGRGDGEGEGEGKKRGWILRADTAEQLTEKNLQAGRQDEDVRLRVGDDGDDEQREGGEHKEEEVHEADLTMMTNAHIKSPTVPSRTAGTA